MIAHHVKRNHDNKNKTQNMNYNKKTIKNRKIKNGIMIITFIISTALTPKLNAFTK